MPFWHQDLVFEAAIKMKEDFLRMVKMDMKSTINL